MAKRQKNGTGMFRVRKDGSIEYRVSLGVKSDGTPNRPSFYGNTEGECLKKFRAWEKEPKNTPIEKVKTVGEWATKWLEVYKKGNIDYSTYRGYKENVDNHIIPAIGALKFDQVKPAHITQMFSTMKNHRGKPMSWSSKKKILICVKAIFNTAKENELCKSNPADKVKLQKPAKQDIEIFTRSEMNKIIGFIPKHAAGPYIALLLYAGLRVGELIALKWPDIDFDEGIIKVRSTLQETEDGFKISDTTKGKRSRIVPVGVAVLSMLKDLPRESMFAVPRAGGGHHTHDSFKAIYVSFFRDLNATLEDDEKVRALSCHKCRHSFGTYAIRSGIPMRVLQELLGHAQITTTEIYANIDISDLQDNAKKLSFKG